MYLEQNNGWGVIGSKPQLRTPDNGQWVGACLGNPSIEGMVGTQRVLVTE